MTMARMQQRRGAGVGGTRALACGPRVTDDQETWRPRARRSVARALAAGRLACALGACLVLLAGCVPLPSGPPPLVEVDGAAPSDSGEPQFGPVPNGAALETAALNAPAYDLGAQPAQAPGVLVNDTGLLDLHVREMDIATVLELISYQARANIVATTSVTGQVSANLYGVTLEEALEAVLTPNRYDFYSCGNTIYVGKEDELAVLRPPATTRVFRLQYLRPAEAAAAVKAVLSKSGVVIEGGAAAAADGVQSGGMVMGSVTVDYIVITDAAERLAAAEKLLAMLDRRPEQVLVEATILRATLNETNQFGIDFAILGGVDFQNVNSLSVASSNLTPGFLPQDKLQDTTLNVNTEFAGKVADGGFTFGLINNSVAFFVRALEEVTDVVVVANPKITALNKQQGEVIVGRRDGYLTTTVTETAAIQKVEFLETGTQIRFVPVINEDGTVRLIVHPKDSNGGLANSLPFEETTEAHADILVPDGGTALIGGLFRERTVNSRQQIPLIGNIPLAGLLFGNRNDATTREEVIILLTVHIIRGTPEEQAENRGLVEDVERIRVGSRRGLLCTGRERLAQAYFQEAIKCFDAGQDDLALLNVRMAINNQPKHLAALKLREELLRRRIWEDEGTRMRTFIWELIEPPPGVLPAGGRREPITFGRPPETERLRLENTGADDQRDLESKARPNADCDPGDQR